MSKRAGSSLTTVAIFALATVALSSSAGAQNVDASTHPLRSNADSARPLREPTSVYDAHRVTRVINEGSHVVLADGTIWEVYLPDRPSVTTWKPGDLCSGQAERLSFCMLDRC